MTPIKPKENTLTYKFKNTAWSKGIDNNVEATFWMIKSIFNDTLRHRRFAGRVNEVLVRVACHNVRCLINSYVKKEIGFPFEND